MNKDEFKYLFLKQFKDENSAIRMLMLCLDPLYRDDGGPYLSQAQFSVHEFSLDISVCKRRIDNSSSYFEAAFYEPKTSDGHPTSNHLCLDGGVFKNRMAKPFYFETVKFRGDEMVFVLQKARLRFENYEFWRENVEPSEELTYNVASRRFVDGSKVVPFLAKIASLRDNHDNYYIDSFYMQKEQAALSHFLNGAFIDKAYKHRIESIFSKMIHVDEHRSCMTNVIWELTGRDLDVESHSEISMLPIL